MLVVRAILGVMTMEEINVKVQYGASTCHLHMPQNLDVKYVTNMRFLWRFGEDEAVTPPDEEVMAILRRRVKIGPLFGKRLLELMLLKRPKENTKCVSAAGEKLTAAKHKLKLLELKLFRDAAAAAHMKRRNVVSATKLPILNPNEFDLWKMRIEHYFLMTDYSLWEVILNGDSPVPTRLVEGVAQPVAPTTVE
uniref:DUF4219 domain-containing protein/UBN2 domain-containing protein n=1 Tax=Tanacetum cinerariifolium TaxID=118510 RepID=A0A6L2KBI6_TANCI|nr:DUF4219 domain-containing protein/UBN2 domain-containing protein [Tanacetum cinerariifolium]